MVRICYVPTFGMIFGCVRPFSADLYNTSYFRSILHSTRFVSLCHRPATCIPSAGECKNAGQGKGAGGKCGTPSGFRTKLPAEPNFRRTPFWKSARIFISLLHCTTRVCMPRVKFGPAKCSPDYPVIGKGEGGTSEGRRRCSARNNMLNRNLTRRTFLRK